MNFLQIPEVKDYRNKLKKHRTERYKNFGVSSKTHIFVHHSLTLEGSAEAYANYHVDTNGWAAIAYHFVIEKDGTIKWCNDLGLCSYHVGDANIYGLGICMTGDFRSQEPTQAQYNSLYKLLEALHKDLSIPYANIRAHQELKQYLWKQCPALDMDSLRGNLTAKHYAPVKNNFNNDLKIEIDVPQLTKEIHTDNKVMWGKTELKRGQKGRLTILKPINLWKRDKDDKLTFSRILHPEEQYRVYGYDEKHGGQYDVGGGYWVTNMDGYVHYETPSKRKLAELDKLN